MSKLSNWTFRNVKSGKTQIGLPLKKLKLAKTKSGDPGEENSLNIFPISIMAEITYKTL